MNHAVTSFLRDMGFRLIDLGQGYPVIDLGQGLSIQIEDWQDHILIALRRPLEAHETERFIYGALRMVHHRFSHEFQIQPGIIGDKEGVLAVQIPVQEVDTPRLREVIELISDVNRRISGYQAS